MNKTLNEIIEENNLKEFKNIFIHSFMSDFDSSWGKMSLEDINKKQKTWFKNDMEYGIVGLKGAKFYSLYDDEKLKDIGIVYSKSKNRKTNHFVILLSGGAFGSCCNLAESFPVSRKLNELGIDTFILNYRTARIDSFVKGLMPEPILDIKSALDFIKEHNDQFNVDTTNYSLIGFSAGSYVVGTYGLMYKEFDEIKPKGILLAYPLIDLNSIGNAMMKDLFFKGLYGAIGSKKKEEKYNLFKNVSNDYPSTYIVLAKDDDTVPIEDPKKFSDILSKLNVNNVYQEAKFGGHGFGLGSATDAKGYIENFLKFIGEYYE